MSDKVILGYWGIRGLGQVPRLLLAYTGQNFEDKVYTSSEAWFQKDQLNLNLTFPNLPYLIDGDLKITETGAITRYIINRSGKHELLGKNLKDQALVDTMLGVLSDIRKPLWQLIFNSEGDKSRESTLKRIAPLLGYFKSFIGEHHFALGYLTIIDFWIAEISYYIEKVFPEQFTSHGFLLRIRNHFESLSEIKEYYSGVSAIRGPFLPSTVSIQI